MITRPPKIRNSRFKIFYLPVSQKEHILRCCFPSTPSTIIFIYLKAYISLYVNLTNEALPKVALRVHYYRPASGSVCDTVHAVWRVACARRRGPSTRPMTPSFKRKNHTHIHTHALTHMQTNTHTYTHTHTHTHIRTHAHIYMRFTVMQQLLLQYDPSIQDSNLGNYYVNT